MSKRTIEITVPKDYIQRIQGEVPEASEEEIMDEIYDTVSFFLSGGADINDIESMVIVELRELKGV